VGGYYTPLKTYGKFEPPQDVNNELDASGPVQVTNQVITILGYPPVEKDEIIYDFKEHKFYEVVEKTETQMQREGVHQSLPTMDLPRDNIVYKLDTSIYNEFSFENYFGILPKASH
jgi:hypothetical protein